MSKVTFDTNIKYIYVPNKIQEQRGLSSEYYRGLISKCEDAENNICKILNKYSPNKIIFENKNYKLKIIDNTKVWDVDNTPSILFNKLKDNIKLKIFILYYNYQISKKISLNHIGDLKYRIGNLDIHIYNVLRKL